MASQAPDRGAKLPDPSGEHGSPASAGGVPPSKTRRSLKTQQHAHLRIFGSESASRFDPPRTRGSEADSVMVRTGSVYAGRSTSMTTLMKKFFTESLILAQDERWRRA